MIRWPWEGLREERDKAEQQRDLAELSRRKAEQRMDDLEQKVRADMDVVLKRATKAEDALAAAQPSGSPRHCNNGACRNPDAVVLKRIVNVQGGREVVVGALLLCTRCAQTWAYNASEVYTPTVGAMMQAAPGARDEVEAAGPRPAW